MTVRELISLNQMITDIVITVRKDGNALLDQLNFGPSEGVKPPFPTKVPISEQYIGTMNQCDQREAYYIPKSINAWDDGKDYWQVKPERLPSKWLNLEVYSWGVWPASQACTTSPRRGRNVNFHGQRINIVALPSGEKLEIVKAKLEKEEDDGQMTLAECGF